MRFSEIESNKRFSYLTFIFHNFNLGSQSLAVFSIPRPVDEPKPWKNIAFLYEF